MNTEISTATTSPLSFRHAMAGMVAFRATARRRRDGRC